MYLVKTPRWLQLLMPAYLWKNYLSDRLISFAPREFSYIGGNREEMEVILADISINKNEIITIEVCLSRFIDQKYMLLGTDFLINSHFNITNFNFTLKKS